MRSSTVVLRFIALLMGAAMLWWAGDLFISHQDMAATLIVLIEGASIVAGVIFEKKRYKPNVDLTAGDWQGTGEKFKDPVTGRVMDVVYNPKTGQRDYVEASR